MHIKQQPLTSFNHRNKYHVPWLLMTATQPFPFYEPPRYSWNFVESGAKHHNNNNPLNSTSITCTFYKYLHIYYYYYINPSGGSVLFSNITLQGWECNIQQYHPSGMGVWYSAILPFIPPTRVSYLNCLLLSPSPSVIFENISTSPLL